MQLTIFNGSPRFKNSNSKILADCFIKGYNLFDKEEVKLQYLSIVSKTDENCQAFLSAENSIIIFPLYTDSMPGIVKHFFETVYDLKIEKPKNVGFIVQSGFPEAIHSVAVEKYLQKFTERLKCNYLGTIIKGGVEGIQIMPPSMTKKIFADFEKLGEIFAKTGKFDNQLKNKLMKPFRMSKFRIFIYKLMSLTGLTNYYWNMNLKKNNAFEIRYDKPYN